uniref:Uncharacterized protein n=1 Tax=Arundo donax TaxID=35708 RepID=A0A0A9AE18_ARUDO
MDNWISAPKLRPYSPFANLIYFVMEVQLVIVY